MILRSAGLFLAITTLALLAWGCDGNGGLLGDETTPSPSGTPPIFQRSPVVPTASPAATGTPATGAATSTPTGQTPVANVAVTPVTAFEITVTEAVNIREAPATDSDVLGIIAPGDRKRVTGQALGQEVTAGSGNRIWYQLEEGGFVYSGLVQKVE